MITFIVTAVPPVPVDPPVAVPPVPVDPPVPVVTLSTQALLAQCWVAPQACPQAPQFAALVVVSTQAVPHSIWLPEQPELQLLLLQTWPVVQAIEQLPQWVASDATQEPLQLSMPDGHLHTLSWQVCPPEQAFPQTPQLLESLAVFTHAVPQAVCAELQVVPVPPVPVLLPPVPVPLFPPVPGLPPCALVQAAERITKPSPKSHARAVLVIATYIPGQTELVFRVANFIAIGLTANSTNTSRKWRLFSLLADARVICGRVVNQLSMLPLMIALAR